MILFLGECAALLGAGVQGKVGGATIRPKSCTLEASQSQGWIFNGYVSRMPHKISLKDSLMKLDIHSVKWFVFTAFVATLKSEHRTVFHLRTAKCKPQVCKKKGMTWKAPSPEGSITDCERQQPLVCFAHVCAHWLPSYVNPNISARHFSKHAFLIDTLPFNTSIGFQPIPKRI